jgi:hypothetical protein
MATLLIRRPRALGGKVGFRLKFYRNHRAHAGSTAYACIRRAEHNEPAASNASLWITDFRLCHFAVLIRILWQLFRPNVGIPLVWFWSLCRCPD